MTIHLSLFKRYLGLLLVPMAFGMLLTVSSCETPEKVLKSPDIEYKKSKATFWYNKKEYFKAIPVLEELIGLLKGRQSVEEYYYMYCMANYKQGDFMIAGYHFKNFYDQYTTSARAEECLFMYAKSYMNLSPKPELDQTYTYKALEAYQYFFNMFPVSNYTTEANEAVAKLRRKLEKKALGNAELYYRTSNYKAAAVSYENLLRDYPDIEEAEKVSFMVVKGFMKYAENSIPSRKMERYNYVIKSYNDFKYKYPSSKYLEEAHRYEIAAHYLATKGAFEWAETSPMDEKERHYLTAFAEAKSQATAEKPAYKKSANKKPTAASKSTKVNQKPVRTADAPQQSSKALQAASAAEVVVGAKVLLKLGQSPMPVTVLEVSKDDVTVQLGSGMVIKTRQDSLYSAWLTQSSLWINYQY